MLGKYDNNTMTSYIQRAGMEHSYFDMGATNWNDAKTIVDNNLEEMWRINKQFIDNRRALGKDFYLSHAPLTDNTFYSREIQYLTKPVVQRGLGGTIVDQGNNLWKVIW